MLRRGHPLGSRTDARMPKRTKPRTHVVLGGQKVSLLRAALIAQEADRRGVLPHKVRRVVEPKHDPTHVVIAHQRLSIEAAAVFAVVADTRGVLLETLITEILNEEAVRLDRRTRRPETQRPRDETSRSAPDSHDDNDDDT